MSKKEDDKDQSGKTAAAVSSLAGQVATIAGQVIGLQMAVGAIIENAPNRDALHASIWGAWERVRAGAEATPPSESRDLLLQSVGALLRQIGIREPESRSD